MASGRVGGTKSKVSGTIGSEVYSLRRNPDGSYSQVISAKPETTTYTNTEKQAAQRMVTAMIEALMRDLTPVARISMQSGVNPSKSINAFSSFNLNKVREDMIANWYGNQKFVYPIKDSDVKLGGIYTISAGTLQLMQGEVNNIGWSYDGWGLNGHKWFNKRVNHWVGMQKRCVCSDNTLGTLLRESNMLRTDVFVSVCNREYFIYNPELEEDEIVYKYDYIGIKGSYSRLALVYLRKYGLQILQHLHKPKERHILVVLYQPLSATNFNHTVATTKRERGIAVTISNPTHQLTAMQIPRRLSRNYKILHSSC